LVVGFVGEEFVGECAQVVVDLMFGHVVVVRYVT